MSSADRPLRVWGGATEQGPIALAASRERSAGSRPSRAHPTRSNDPLKLQGPRRVFLAAAVLRSPPPRPPRSSFGTTWSRVVPPGKWRAGQMQLGETRVRQKCSRLTRQCCHTSARRHWGVRRPTAAPLEEESPARPPPPSRYRRPLDVGGGPRCRLSNPLVILGEGGLSAARSSLSSHTRRLCLCLCGRILSLHNNGVLPLWVHHGSSES